MMGLFDKIKKTFESDKKNDDSENNTNNVNFKEKADDKILVTPEQEKNNRLSTN